MGTVHEPVLLKEVLEMLALDGSKSGVTLIDATLGGAGHTRAILEQNPRVFVVGIDRDPQAIARARDGLHEQRERVFLVQGNFADLEEHLAALPTEVRSRLSLPGSKPQVDRILLDLGISSDQLDDSARGFSFRADGPLDMRMDPGTGRSAAEILNSSTAQELERLFLRGGLSQPLPRRLTKSVIDERPLSTTGQFAELCRRAAPREYGRQPSKDAATVPFQALRIAVNDEQEALENFLPQAFDALNEGGRLAVISFHSLEDRAVARAMRSWSRTDEGAAKLPVRGPLASAGRLLTAKAIVPGEEEISRNPRARSARLRVFEKAGRGGGK